MKRLLILTLKGESMEKIRSVSIPITEKFLIQMNQNPNIVDLKVENIDSWKFQQLHPPRIFELYWPTLTLNIFKPIS